jgi:hypothetical protein
VVSTVRTVMGIKGEPSPPGDPAQGLVWRAIVDQVDVAGSESAFVSVADTPRATFAKHPWSIGGGGAADLRERLEDSRGKLSAIAETLGVMAVTGEDDVFSRNDASEFVRVGVPSEVQRPLVVGDLVRDWGLRKSGPVIYEYSENGEHAPNSQIGTYFWTYRSLMKPAIYFGKTKEQRGMHWREYGVVVKDKLRSPNTITFAFVATHNHFVLDRGGKVFNRKRSGHQAAGRSERGGSSWVDGASQFVGQDAFGCSRSATTKVARRRVTAKDEKWHDFYEYTGTKLAEFPLPEIRNQSLSPRPSTASRRNSLRAARQPGSSGDAHRAALDAARTHSESALANDRRTGRTRLALLSTLRLTQTELTCNASTRNCPRRARLRNRHRPSHRYRAGRNHVVCPWRIQPINRNPLALAGTYRAHRRSPHRADRIRQIHRPDRTPNYKRRWETSTGKIRNRPPSKLGCSTAWKRR